MKVLHATTFKNTGGAAVAVNTLNAELNKQGIIQSQVINLQGSQIRNVWDSLPKLLYFKRTSEIFSLSWLAGSGLTPLNHSYADVIHLHWINKGLLGIKDLQKISKPVIWTFHDSWPFTGGCHVPFDCEGFMQGCGKCPKLASNSSKDISARTLQLKQKYYPSSLNLVVPSQWMKRNVQKSSLFRNHSVHVIPNGLDSQVFKPQNKKALREKLNIESNQKMILFGAVDLDDKNKGAHLLLTALQRLKDKGFLLVTFGKALNSIKVEGIQQVWTGYIDSPQTLSQYYAAADVTVVPSMQESLGYTVMESLACGTPTVAFGGSGPDDLIEHQKNGYLAKPYDTQDLAKGIEWVLEDSVRWQQLSNRARQKVEQEFDIKIVAKKYQQLYETVLKTPPSLREDRIG